MHRFSLWAPKLNAVSVDIDGRKYAMSPGTHGWWHADVADVGHGQEYAFALNGDDKLYPDPRSAWQPDGVHGRSRVLDHSRFEWTDAGWSPVALSEAVIYELHIGTFTAEGMFAAAIHKLDYLHDLGVTHVELMPVNSFPGRWGWGYDGTELYAPQECYGGPDELKRLVNACHAKGLAVLLDVVYNHFGPSGNYAGVFGPYVTENHHTPWGGAVNLEEGGSTEVRRYFCDNALMWLRDYHFDGLRLDAVHAFVDRSAIHFLEQLAIEVDELSTRLERSMVLIAESDLNDPRVVAPRVSSAHDHAKVQACGGYGMDAQWSDDFHHALFALITGERQGYYADFGSLAQLAKSLQDVYVYDGIYSEYRGRVHGRPVRELSAHRFLGFIQDHDQVGNRAFGDRLAAIVGHRKAKLAAAMVMTAPFVPMLFQGEEFAASAPFLYFADHDDPELARAVSEGRRKEHASNGSWDAIPDPESGETFERSKLPWGETYQGPGAEMLDWYRKLIALRADHACLRDGQLDRVSVNFNEAARWLVMTRGAMQLLFNFGDEPASIAVPESGYLVLASEADVRIEADYVTLPHASFVAVLSAES